ncbi:MAG TPA: prepilin-type N-terminal cleavage/methylation domain-containing protein [Acidimicrobiales bacterium]|nr:prepilin-type N-terminal cleavage/methylation domain-containing protein [Acidimicrobiales bacterium]
MIERLNRKRGEEGFTLIELLIVIVILGILAAIVVFAVGGTGTNAAVAACKSDAASLETALESYKAQQNPPAFPDSPTTHQDSNDPGWKLLLSPPGNASSNTPYLRTVPPAAHYQLWWDTNGVVWVLAPKADYPPAAAGLKDDANFDKTNGDACKTYAS